MRLRRLIGRAALAALAACAALTACGNGTSPPTPTGTATATVSGSVARPAHVVVVVMENHSYGQIVGSASAPYISALAHEGAYFTDAHAVTHPSQPNYLALFSGSTQGIGDDSCPHTFPGAADLGAELLRRHLTFAGYSESMPSTGYTGCGSGDYARKHNPWVDFPDVPAADNRTFAAFPTDYARLPTVAIVVPNLCHDMHDCGVSTGDAWLKANLGAYVRWAMTNDGLFVLTFDENDGADGNRIPLIMVGQHVRAGSYGEDVSHYTVLRTLEDLYGLPRLGHSAAVAPITSVWG